MKTRSLILPALCLLACHLQAQQIIRGTVVENDSSSVMPFVYIINKSNGNGTMSDNDGRFYLATNENDTLVCSYVGFAKANIPVKQLKPNAKGEVRIVMRQLPYALEVVNVTVFNIKPYEREYMKDIIDRSQIRKLSYFENPFTAMYMQYSKEGRQVRKLAAIFEKIMIEEQVQKKLSREVLVRLTADENIDYEAFRKYCFYVSDYYIIEHDGVDLYSKVMDCYRRWKSDLEGESRRRGNYRARDSDPHKAAEKEGQYREH